jgi:recombination associated protein RdgC
VAFLSASTGVVRFVATPPSRLDRDAVAAAVSRRAFCDLAPDGELRQSAGWVGLHDPLATTLDATDLFFQHYLVVGFRFDRRTVPPKLLFLERRRLEAARRAEQGLERLPAAVRKEIKAEVESRLLVRALPVPRLFDCVWNLDTGRVYFSGRLRAAREAFVDLFRQTFAVTPVPLVPWLAAAHVGLPARVVDAVRAAAPSSLMAEGRPAGVPRLPLGEAAG